MLEITIFSLVRDDDAAVAAFLEADTRLQTGFAYRQPGLVRRTTARGEGGRWTVVTLWSGSADADRAAGAALTDPSVAAFDAFVDPAGRSTERFTPLP